MSGATLEQIVERRAALNVSEYTLTRVAGVNSNFFNQHRGGDTRQSPASLAALAIALHRLEHNPDCDATERAQLTDMVVRVLIVLLARLEGVDPLMVHAQKPSRRASFDPDWRTAARIREAAFGLCNTALGIKGAQLASAGGVSRAAITMRLQRNEDRRDDPAFDALMDQLENELRGWV